MSAIELVTPVKFELSEDTILAKREEYASLSADTPKGYEQVRLAIADCRGMRTAIETKRKELKAGALEYGRMVDNAAKTLTELIEGFEEPLKAKKALVDEEKARVKREKEEAERARIEAELKAKRDAEEAAAKAAREAEERRLAEERARIEEEQRAIKMEREKLEAEKRAAEEETRRTREAEEARIRQAREAAIREAEERKAQEERLLVLAPDREKAADFARRIRDLRDNAPTMATEEGAEAIRWATRDLGTAVEILDDFVEGKETAA